MTIGPHSLVPSVDQNQDRLSGLSANLRLEKELNRKKDGLILHLLKLVIAGLLIIGQVSCATLGSKANSHSKWPDPRALRYPSLQFQFPKVERTQLSNGLIVYLLPDHEIPIVNIATVIRTGSVYEPQDKIGLASLTGEVMRTGGTASLSSAQLDEELEFHSMLLASSIGRDSANASLSVLTKNLDRGLQLFFEVLRHPVFEEDKVDLAKQKKIEAIRRKNDSPQEVAFREFRKLIYKGDPRANEPSIAGVQQLTRQDMIWFHQRYFHPENIIMGVSGDFKPEEMIAKLEALTAGWEALPEPVSTPPVPGPFIPPSVNIVPKKIPQSIIVMGGFSMPKNHPDYYAFTLLNDIVGGDGFNSYLTEEIRSNRGLAYSVGSFYSAYEQYGVFGTYCFTSTPNTQLAISLLKEILLKIKAGNISPQKLQWAKDSIINQFVFSFSSADGLVAQMISLEYSGLPRDYLEHYQENIGQVTIEDLQRVAQTYLKPEEYTLLVLGDGEFFDQALTEFGPINKVNIDIY